MRNRLHARNLGECTFHMGLVKMAFGFAEAN